MKDFTMLLRIIGPVLLTVATVSAATAQTSPADILRGLNRAPSSPSGSQSQGSMRSSPTDGSGQFAAAGYRQPQLIAAFQLDEPGRLANAGVTASQMRYFILHLVGTANQTCPNVDARIPNSIVQSIIGPMDSRDGMANRGLGILRDKLEGLANPDKLMRDTMENSVWEADARNDASTFIQRYGCTEDINKLLRTAALFHQNPQRGAADNSSSAPANGVLDKQEISIIYGGVISGNCLIRDTPACAKFRQFYNTNQTSLKIIQCTYRAANGVSRLSFWHGGVPDDLASYAVPGEDHPFMELGTKAVDACPPQLSQAEALRAGSRLPRQANAR